MDLGLKGKTALVAGSSRGLGRAVAETLAAEGANLVLCSRSRESLEETAEQIQSTTGVDVFARPVDVSREEDVGGFVNLALERFPRIDILIANAGGPPASRFEDTEISQWREGIDSNLMSTVFLCRAVVPAMRKQKWGRIVAITSISVKQPVDGLILSNVSRLGVVGLTKSMANELAPDGITVNTVCPGFTRTQRLLDLAERMAEQEKVSRKDVYRRWTDAIPMGRLGEPNEFAAVVAFLSSEQASYVTGTCVQVNGGFVKGIL